MRWCNLPPSSRLPAQSSLSSKVARSSHHTDTAAAKLYYGRPIRFNGAITFDKSVRQVSRWKNPAPCSIRITRGAGEKRIHKYPEALAITKFNARENGGGETETELTESPDKQSKVSPSSDSRKVPVNHTIKSGCAQRPVKFAGKHSTARRPGKR